MPPSIDVAVHPDGITGAVTPSKFCENVVVGTPAVTVRVKLNGPRPLLTLNVRVRGEPQGIPRGTVKLTCCATVTPLFIVP
jgi:hypothetical protein